MIPRLFLGRASANGCAAFVRCIKVMSAGRFDPAVRCAVEDDLAAHVSAAVVQLRAAADAGAANAFAGFDHAFADSFDVYASENLDGSFHIRAASAADAGPAFAAGIIKTPVSSTQLRKERKIFTILRIRSPS